MSKSNYTIRKIRKADLPAIVSFQKENSVFGHEMYNNLDTLEWLFRNPFSSQEYNGFVAKSEDNKVLGIIGFAINEYRIGEKVLTGVTPSSWVVASSERGMLGIRLLLAVLKQGDFSFALGGTKMALTVYKAVKLKFIGKADGYTKVFNPYRYNQYKSNLSKKDILKSIYFFSKKSRVAANSSLLLRPYLEEDVVPTYRFTELAILPVKERDKWIMDCPEVESRAFSLEYQGKKMGNCICYISTGNKNYKRGRIVLIPYAGNDINFYKQTIVLLERYLVENGCSSVSLFTNHTTLKEALRSCGYRTHKMLQGYPIYIRFNRKDIKSLDFSDWFLSYYESNKGHLYF